MTDSTDAITASTLVFDEQNGERNPWTICSQECSRSFLFFSFQVIVILILVLTSVFRIILASTCEESSVWVAILSSCVGYVLPSPRLG